jgi:4-amino-4-deoxy-L-arabinose transferase-like glycosyltransferase
MSTDIDRLLSRPTDMIWEPDQELTPTIRYRLIDAPLTRYIIGLGRKIFALPAQTVDWDWSATLFENKQSGALPQDPLLSVARLSVASLFPLALILIYQLGSMLSGKIAGLTAVLIFATNALVLLHTRRAMAESVLIFSVIACLFVFLKADKRPLLAGLMVGLAFNAKHSGIALFPIGLVAVCWIPIKKPKLMNRISRNLIQYFFGFFLLVLILNPILWRHPVRAAQESLLQRQALLQKQVADVNLHAPSQVLDSPAQRAAILLAQLFIIPPTFSEVGNYRSQTAQAEIEYLNYSGHNFWRDPVAGGIFLGITLLGILAILRNSNFRNPETRREILLFQLAFLIMVSAQIALVPLPWQRYSLPLIPFISIYFGIGFTWAIKNSLRILSRGRHNSRLSKILAQLSPDSWVS